MDAALIMNAKTLRRYIKNYH